jgi:uncharacterized iron-regulated membrane protein
MNLTPPNSSKKRPVLLKISKHVSVVHRWLGISLCLLLAMWFATGGVLSFVPFPSLSGDERIAGGEVIDPNRIRVEPAVAMAAADSAFVEHFRLISVQGRPRYLLSLSGGPVVAVGAEDGELLNPLTPDAARGVAERFSGLTAVRIEGPFDYDQWIVNNVYDPYRPLYKVDMNDAAATTLYVSARSGEVVQRTRRTERIWNYVGAVSHWINPTILRKDYAVWNRVMWTLVLSGIVLTLAGGWLGLVRYINLRRQRRSGLSPFTGWLRWHHSIGLFAGVLVLSWASSGALMLNKGRTFFPSDRPSTDRIGRLRGISLADAAATFPTSQLGKLRGAREMEFIALGARAFLLVRSDGLQVSQVVSIDGEHGLRFAAVVPDALLVSAVQSAWWPSGVVGVEHVTADDAYILRGKPLPPTTRRIVLGDPAQTWVQVDAASGQIISILDRSRRVYRWLVDGLHTFDFPVLNRVGSLWHVLLLMGVASGFVFSCTGIVIGVKRLRRSIG